MVIRLFVLTTLFYTVPTWAGSLLLDLRTDWDNASYSESYAGKFNSSAFVVQTGRIDWKGKLNDNLLFRIRPRFDNARTNDGVDRLTTGIDLAYIHHQIDWVSLTIGKMPTEIALHENLTSPADIYMRSEALNAITSGYKLPSNTNVEMLYPVKFMTGAKLTFISAQHELGLLAVNNPEADQASTSPNQLGGQTRLMMGVVYKGRFLESALQPIFSFHTAKLGGDTSKTATDNVRVNYYSAGIKYNVPKFFVQLDYGQVVADGVMDAGVSHKGQIESLSLDGGYRFKNLVARLKLERSLLLAQPTVGMNTEQEVLGGSVALELRPWPEHNFRYHVAYSHKEIHESAVADKTEDRFIVGFAILADFLKE